MDRVRSAGGLLFTLALALAGTGTAHAQHGPTPTRLDCASMDCAGVLPGAVRFVREGDHRFDTGYAADGSVVGWVAMSNELVDVPAYSGRPVVVLFGLDHQAVIAGTRVIHHSEPILLAGIPESELTEFVAWYEGHRATERISVGSAARAGSVAVVDRQVRHEHDEEHEDGEHEHHDVQVLAAVDVISGATVTALATNRTILEAARVLGAEVGVIDPDADRVGRFVAEGEPWTWERMAREGVFGRLTVTQEQMGLPARAEPFVDLWFTIADAPAIGRALMPRGDYDHLITQMGEGEHLVVVLGNGTSSFKGSAFVRGGIFDRVRIEQGLTEIQFRDTDYLNVGRVPAQGAPRFREGAAFLTRGGHLDPGRPFELVFLGSHHDSRGGFSREFRSFEGHHQLPPSVYFVEEPPEELAVWEEAWQRRALDVVVLSSWLAIVAAIFALRRFTFRDKKVLARLHVASMVVSFLLVGVHFAAQPSVTQMLTLIGIVVHGGDPALFLVEPLLFVSWIFIAIVSLVWGRGVFCGWVCPYGVMSELTRKLGDLVKIPRLELPPKVHRKLRYLRYGVLAVLIVVFVTSPQLGEEWAEIEPFKSTFLVPFWGREWFFAAWWIVLFGISIFVWRPFCRYLCPMGAGLALFGSFRLSGPYRRSYCSSCKLCQRGCEPKAIEDDGTIDPRECLSCMECEQTYNDRDRCPPLVGIDRLLAKRDLAERDHEKLAKLREQEAKVPWKPGR